MADTIPPDGVLSKQQPGITLILRYAPDVGRDPGRWRGCGTDSSALLRTASA
jgi:hypothetical protein